MMSRIARVIALAALASAPTLLTSCGSTTTESKNPIIAVSLSGGTLAVTQGSSQNLTLTLTRTDFTGDVSLSATGLPNGVTATFTPATLTGSTLSSTLAIAAAADAAPGTVTVTLHATGTGVTEQTATFSLTVNVAGSYSLAASPTSVSVQQGANATSSINITRVGGFGGDVALTVTGAPSGVTATFSPATLSTGTASSTLTVAATGAATTGTATLTIHGASAGTADQTTSLTVNVTPAPGVTLALNPTSVSIGQGGSATSTVTITRVGGFTGAVDLTTTGTTTGVTASFSPASVTGTTSTLTLTAAGDATVGTGTVVVHANGTGISEATASLGTTVTAPSTTAISLNVNCISDHGTVLFFAYRNSNASSWTPVTPSGGVLTMNVTSTFQVAEVTSNGNGGTDVGFHFLTSAAVLPQSGVSCAARMGSVGVTGSVANIGTGFVQIQAANAGAVANPGSLNFSLDSLPSTGVDLVAVLAGSGSGFTPTGAIVRRNQTYTNGGTVATLDFGTSEAVAPKSASLTVSNIGADTANTFGMFTTSTGTYASMFGGGTTGTSTVYGMPDASLAAGDIHQLYVEAQPKGANPTDTRAVILYQHSLSGGSVTLGPTLSTPTVTVASSTPYVMMRVQMPLQAEYNMGLQAKFTQGNNRVQVQALAAYFNGMTSWDVTMPDLSGVPGWNNAWGLQTGQSTGWQLMAFGNSLGDFISNGTDGDIQYFASTQNTLTTAPAMNMSTGAMPLLGARIFRLPPLVRR